MQVLRTLALVAAVCGGVRAAAQDTGSPAPAIPNPTTTAPPGSPTSPSTPPSTPGITPPSSTSPATLNTAPNASLMSIGDQFLRTGSPVDVTGETNLQLGSLPPNLSNLVITNSAPSTNQPKLYDSGFEHLTALTALSFINIDFDKHAVQMSIPTTLSYLKIEHSNLDDLSLVSSAITLTTIDLNNTQFSRIPFFLYQRTYNPRLNVMGLNVIRSNVVTKLGKQEFENIKANLNLTVTSTNGQNCVSGDRVGKPFSACLDPSLPDLRTFNASTESSHSTTLPETSTPTSIPIATPTTPTPTARSKSSNATTLTVIVVIIAVVAAVLAYFVARRYFCTSSSLSGSPPINERTVGLISKDDSNAANNKLSFISSDDALRQIRLEQQEVTVTKSVGTGRLWVGDYSGRKVMIKRVEAESSDSHATKALISQARSLAPLSHPNVVSLVGVTWVQGTDFGIVSEFMEKGTLKTVLMDLDSDLDLQSKLHMCLDVAHGIKFLHSTENNLYMRRLTSRKVLVNGAIECKLNLFECQPCTNKIEYPEVFGAGEMAWEAPELITRTGVLDARKINIFSFGVLMSEVLTRASPYQSTVDALGHTLADLELLKRIRHQERLLPHENRREFTEAPAALREMIERCLSYQPLARPTADEIVQCLESVKNYSERIGSTTSL